jgi:hypothetical protein
MPSEDASTAVIPGEARHTVSIGDVGLSPGEVRWSVDGSAVAVVDTIDGRWWPWFDDQSPLIGLIGFLAAALVLARSVVRLVRMPRIEGRAYCRRCNHDLDGGRAGDPCPECGCIQHGRERAVPTWRRSETLLIGLSLLVMVVGAGRLITRVQVQSAGQALASRGLAWPLASLQSVDGWPLWRVWRPQDDVRRAGIVVRRIDLVGGIVLDAPPIDAWKDPGSGVVMTPSPDGASGAGVQRVSWSRLLVVVPRPR